MLLTPTTFEINFCGQREGTSPQTSIIAASCQHALTTKAGGTNARAHAVYTLACVRCFDTMAVAKTVRLVVARRARTGITRRPSLRNTVRRVACFEAIAPVANFVMA